MHIVPKLTSRKGTVQCEIQTFGEGHDVISWLVDSSASDYDMGSSEHQSNAGETFLLHLLD